MTENKLAHKKISPTAKMVAYWRQFAELPYSRDIAELFHTKDTMTEIFSARDIEKMRNSFLIPYAELRYKSLQHAIESSGIKQIIEFASGISLRGLYMSKDPSLTYVETDLPELMEEKLPKVKEIMNRHHISQRNNLHFHTVNVLNYDETVAATQYFDPRQPILIIHEGLFQYLTREEKTIAAQNFHKILSKFGGAWLTPDLEIKQTSHDVFIDDEDLKNLIETIGNLTNRSFSDNSFADEKDVYDFFHQLGFDVKNEPQWKSTVAISGFKADHISEKYIEGMKSLPLWHLTIRDVSSSKQHS